MYYLARRFAELLGPPVPELRGQRASTALLSNASRVQELFAYRQVPREWILRWVAYWVGASGRTMGKPTHFEEREGRF